MQPQRHRCECGPTYFGKAGRVPVGALRRARGYGSLKEIAARPWYEDHLERLDWLGPDAADEFNPDVLCADEASAPARLSCVGGVTPGRTIQHLVERPAGASAR